MKKNKLILVLLFCSLISIVFANISDSEISVGAYDVNVGEQFSVEILTTEIDSFWEVSAYQFSFNYNSERISFIGYEIDETLSENGLISINDNTPGILNIGFMTTSEISGIGSLIKLNFESLVPSPSQLAISDFVYNTTAISNITNGSVQASWLIEEIDDSHILLGAGNVSTDYPFYSENSSFPILTTLIEDEWNVNSYEMNLTYDNSVILIDSVSTNETISDIGTINYTISDSGNLNITFESEENLICTPTTEPYEILLFVHFTPIQVGSADLDFTTFTYNDIPVENFLVGEINVTPFTGDISEVSIELPELNCDLGSSIEVPIQTSYIPESWNITAYQFIINYDPSKLLFYDYNKGNTLSENGLVTVNDLEAGQLAFGYMGTTAISGIDDLVTLNFYTLEEGISNIECSSFIFNTTSIDDIDNSSVTIIDNGVEVSDLLIYANNQLSEVDDEIEIDISVTNIDPTWNVNSYTLELFVDNNILSYDSLSVAGTLSEIGEVTAAINESNITIEFTSSEMISGIGSLIKLKFQGLTPGSFDVQIIDFTLNSDVSITNKVNGSVSLINTNDSPEIVIPLPNIEFNEDETYTMNINGYFSDPDLPYGDMLTIQLMPNEYLTASLVDTTLTVIPNANWNGSTVLELNLSDSQDVEVIAELELNVLPVNDAPSLDFPSNIVILEDEASTFTLFYASDIDGDDLTITWEGNTSISVNMTEWSLEFSAPHNWNGEEVITISASDNQGRLIATQDVTVTFIPVNDSPVINTFDPAETVFDYAGDGSGYGSIDFSVDAIDVDSEITYSWFVDGEEVSETSDEFLFEMNADGDYIVKAEVTDGNMLAIQQWSIHTNGTANDIISIKTELLGSYPNPFYRENSRSTTTISFNLEKAEKINLCVYNIKGQKIVTLFDGIGDRGSNGVTWNGKNNNDTDVASGIYFYRLITPKASYNKKMIIVQ